MVHFRVQSINCLELHKKATNSSPSVIEIANERVYGTLLRMLSKMDLRVQMDVKSGQLKNELLLSLSVYLKLTNYIYIVRKKYIYLATRPFDS